MNLAGSDLSISDIRIFVQAGRLHSLRELGRQTGLRPAHVSKVIARVEKKLGIKVFQRSASGIILTPEGLDVLQTAEKICELAEQLLGHERPGKFETAGRVWSIGSISFLSTYCLAPSLAQLSGKSANTRFRLIEFTHNELVAHGLNGAFEAALHIEPLEWTRLWTSKKVGTLSWKLYGRAGHPLGQESSEADLLKFPFIVPTDWTGKEYLAGEDHCPLSVRQRKKGHEAATAETAIEIVRTSDQLTFVPEIVARSWGRDEGAREIKVKGWPVIEKDIYLSVRSDIVPNKLMKLLVSAVQEKLK